MSINPHDYESRGDFLTSFLPQRNLSQRNGFAHINARAIGGNDNIAVRNKINKKTKKKTKNYARNW